MGCLYKPISKFAQMRRIFIFILTFVLFLPSYKIEAQRRKKATGFRVDFRDKQILDFLKAMSNIIGKNIIADQQVSGKITVISPVRIPRKLAFVYLKSVLAVRGFGIVEEDGLIKVVTLKDAVAKSPTIYLSTEVAKDENQQKGAITHIVPLVNSRPSRIATILKRITNSRTGIVDYDELKMVILTGGSQEVTRLVRIIAHIDKKLDEDDSTDEKFGNVFFYRLKNLKAETVEKTLKRLRFPQRPDPKTKSRKPPKPLEIVSHADSNSLIFIGEETDFENLKKLIQRLDTVRQQVLLEVLIVEVVGDSNNSFGIDWRVGKLTQFNSGLALEGNLVNKEGDFTGINTLLGFSLGVIQNGSENIMSLLSANMKKENFAVISAPQVLTLENQQAEINVGEDVPVISNARLTDNNTTINNYDYRPVGVKLKFTPQISSEKMITLDLFQEVKAISGHNEVSKNPRFSKKDLKTVVRVRNKQTIVIGGLISTEKTKNVRKIPLLGDIPLLGYLFKRESTGIRKTNLLVFITPHILTNTKDANSKTEALRKSQKKEFKKQGIP